MKNDETGGRFRLKTVGCAVAEVLLYGKARPADLLPEFVELNKRSHLVYWFNIEEAIRFKEVRR